MKPFTDEPSSFDENQSIQVIRDMIAVSRNKLRHDGILFVVWGWVMFISTACSKMIS